MSILPPILSDFNYYKNKLPMYLRNNESFLSHFKIWFDFLIGEKSKLTNGLVGAADSLLDLINVWDKDYFQKLNKLKLDTILLPGSILAEDSIIEKYSFVNGKLYNEKTTIPFTRNITEESRIAVGSYLAPYSKAKAGSILNGHKISSDQTFWPSGGYVGNWLTPTNLLDKLASIFNIKRSFTIGQGGVWLNDYDLLTYIKATIIKNYCNGTSEQIIKYYRDAGLNIFFKSTSSAVVNVYLLEIPGITNVEYSNEIKFLFRNGLLNIESMGIQYQYVETEYNLIFVWDKELITDVYSGWGAYPTPAETSGRWGI